MRTGCFILPWFNYEETLIIEEVSTNTHIFIYIYHKNLPGCDSSGKICGGVGFHALCAILEGGGRVYRVGFGKFGKKKHTHTHIYIYYIHKITQNTKQCFHSKFCRGAFESLYNV